MLSDEIRARLAQLYTRPSPDARVGRAAPVADVVHVVPRRVTSRRADPLAAAVACQNASGEHLRICRPLASFWSAAPLAATSGAAVLRSQPMHAELAAVHEHFPQGTLFLDLETCGFAGSSIFLAGLVRHCNGQLVVEQLFARHYGEERALLETLWQIAAEHRVLVTFNGKSFDWPMVHDRSTRHHLGRDLRRPRGGRRLQVAPTTVERAAGAPLGRTDARPELLHCDLLHHARRRWRHQLPNCKLQTLERYACRRWRQDDLSGALVPAAYHQFVRSGDARPIGAILEHNALDLATLVEVTLQLIAA